MEEMYSGKRYILNYYLTNLISNRNLYPQHEFKFIGTQLYPNSIISWRGSYDIPALLAGYDPKIGAEISDFIYRQIEKIHTGYKGGEYGYALDDEFYVVTCPSSSAHHAVNGYKVNDGVVWLITNIKEY